MILQGLTRATEFGKRHCWNYCTIEQISADDRPIVRDCPGRSTTLEGGGGTDSGAVKMPERKHQKRNLHTHVTRRGRRTAVGEHVGFVERGCETSLSGGVGQCGDPGVALCTVACDESPRSLAAQHAWRTRHIIVCQNSRLGVRNASDWYFLTRQ